MTCILARIIKSFVIFNLILMKKNGGVSLCSGIWEHIVYFQLHSNLWFSWHFSACILGVEKVPIFQSPTTSSYGICNAFTHRKSFKAAVNCQLQGSQ